MTESKQYETSIFWVPIDKIIPNPYQPRREFDEVKLKELADSIRQYGLLQPLVVTKKETEHGDGNITVEYELIAGERRLRASKIAGLSQLPVLIRSREESDQMKLELAIIENLQREDLNVIDRARAFKQLAEQFSFTHGEIGRKVGKSREYVSNSIRVLLLPDNIQQSLIQGHITEGHTRPLLMLAGREAEQETLFAEILSKKLNVREAEDIARRIAVDKARKKPLNPEMLALEKELTESLGTRVHIEQKEVGGKLVIDYFSPEDLRNILAVIRERQAITDAVSGTTPIVSKETEEIVATITNTPPKEEEDLYSLKNFSL